MNDLETLFRNRDACLDVAGYPIDKYERMGRNPEVFITLFREIERVAKSYVGEHKPTHVFDTAGFDRTRFSRYCRLAMKLANVGYSYGDDPDWENVFSCYREVF